MDKEITIEGVNYKTKKKPRGCKGCVADGETIDNTNICLELGNYCLNEDIIWIKK